jgi:hypothetical protein
MYYVLWMFYPFVFIFIVLIICYFIYLTLEYVGMVEESDGTLSGDFDKGIHTLVFTEMVRGIHVTF